jgi:hypothetical protein
MARLRSRSVRRRKQRGGDSWFSKIFGSKPSPVTDAGQKPEPVQLPQAAVPSKKYQIETPLAVATLQLYNKTDNISIGQIVTLKEGSANELTSTFAPSFAKYQVYTFDNKDINIPDILINNGVKEVSPMTGGRRNRKNRSRRSTRKQRR